MVRLAAALTRADEEGIPRPRRDALHDNGRVSAKYVAGYLRRPHRITAHESVLVDDAVTSAMLRHVSAADPDALAEAAAAIAGRYHELRER